MNREVCQHGNNPPEKCPECSGTKSETSGSLFIAPEATDAQIQFVDEIGLQLVAAMQAREESPLTKDEFLSGHLSFCQTDECWRLTIRLGNDSGSRIIRKEFSIWTFALRTKPTRKSDEWELDT